MVTKKSLEMIVGRFKQHLYTSSKVAGGMFTLAKSTTLRGIDEDEVKHSVEYSIAEKLPVSPIESEIRDLFPIKWSFREINGQYLFARTFYVGKDYSQRYGNFIAHSFITDQQTINRETPAAIFEKLNQNEFITEKLSEEDEIEYHNNGLSETELEIEKPRQFWGHINKLIDNHPHKGVLLMKALNILVDFSNNPDRKFLLLADKNELYYWVCSMVSLFPPGLCKDISFTTYNNRPNYDASIIGFVKECNLKLREAPKDKFVVIDYLDDYYSEEPKKSYTYCETVIKLLEDEDIDGLYELFETVKSYGITKLSPEIDKPAEFRAYLHDITENEYDFNKILKGIEREFKQKEDDIYKYLQTNDSPTLLRFLIDFSLKTDRTDNFRAAYERLSKYLPEKDEEFINGYLSRKGYAEMESFTLIEKINRREWTPKTEHLKLKGILFDIASKHFTNQFSKDLQKAREAYDILSEAKLKTNSDYQIPCDSFFEHYSSIYKTSKSHEKIELLFKAISSNDSKEVIKDGEKFFTGHLKEIITEQIGWRTWDELIRCEQKNLGFSFSWQDIAIELLQKKYFGKKNTELRGMRGALFNDLEHLFAAISIQENKQIGKELKHYIEQLLDGRIFSTNTRELKDKFKEEVCDLTSEDKETGREKTGQYFDEFWDINKIMHGDGFDNQKEDQTGSKSMLRQLKGVVNKYVPRRKRPKTDSDKDNSEET